MALMTLEDMDSMKLWAVIPVALAFGLVISTALLRTRDLVVPLWMGRQLMKWSGTSLFFLLLLGYMQVQTGLQHDNQRKLFVDYQ